MGNAEEAGTGDMGLNAEVQIPGDMKIIEPSQMLKARLAPSLIRTR